MAEQGSTITVQVLGESLRIRGGDPEEVEALARYVDERVAQIRARNEGVPLRGLLLLTSLNIAEELFRERREHERLVRSVEEKTRRLRESLEARLAPAPSAQAAAHRIPIQSDLPSG